MRARHRGWLLPLLLASCGTQPTPPDVAVLPPGVFAAGDQDIPAVQFAQYAFSDAGRTYGNPAEGAQAVLALDYIAGELATNGRWSAMPAATVQDLQRARLEVREAVGIAPGAPSQAVVAALNQARNGFAAGDRAAALHALSAPFFTKGAAATAETLANLPYVRIANVATAEASEALFEPANEQSGPTL